MNIDALADEPEQIFMTPYQYGWNNPIYYNDPDGNCPKCKEYASKFFSGVSERISGLLSTENIVSTVVPLAGVVMNVGITLSADNPSVVAKAKLADLGQTAFNQSSIGIGNNLINNPKELGKSVVDAGMTLAAERIGSSLMSFGKSAAQVNTTGTANIYQYEGTSTNRFGHYAIETEFNGTKVMTDQVITSSDLSTTTIRTRSTGDAINVAKVELPNAKAAQKYQNNQIGKQLGAYDKRCNSCVNHVGGVLREGGLNVPGSALKEFGFIKTLFDNQY